MLINPNLYGGPQYKFIQGNSKTSPSGMYYDFDTALDVGKKYTFSADVKQSFFEGSVDSGMISCVLCTKKRSDFHNFADVAIKNGRFKFTFIAKSESQAILVYSGLRDKTFGVKTECTNVKLEEGEGTPFIPHKNTLETAKRQYFIGGVRSKRCIHSSPRGGALC